MGPLLAANVLQDLQANFGKLVLQKADSIAD